MTFNQLVDRYDQEMKENDEKARKAREKEKRDRLLKQDNASKKLLEYIFSDKLPENCSVSRELDENLETSNLYDIFCIRLSNDIPEEIKKAIKTVKVEQLETNCRTIDRNGIKYNIFNTILLDIPDALKAKMSAIIKIWKFKDEI